MRATGALLALALAACAGPQPRPPRRAADVVEVQQIRVGWMQLANGRPDRYVLQDKLAPKPDEVEAREIAQRLLDECEKGAPMEPLQKKYSETDPGIETIDDATRVPWRDLALSLKPGQCAMMRSDIGFHVVKRVR